MQWRHPVPLDALQRSARGGQHCAVGRSRGDSYDNALAESIIGLYKTEVIHRKGPWRHLEAVEFVTLDWVDWFIHGRLLAPICYVPPAEYEARFYDQPAVTGVTRRKSAPPSRPPLPRAARRRPHALP